MIIAPQQLEKYLKDNEGKEIGNEGITFELCSPKKESKNIHYTICFKKIKPPYWSKKNVSRIGPERIEYFLEIFNHDNNAPASEYRNRKGQGKESKNARYLVKLLKELVKQNS
jgi:hypothetical protein